MKRIYHYLTDNILKALEKIPDELRREICEIRLRRGGPLSVTTYTKNLIISKDGKPQNRIENFFACTAEDITTVISRFCEGSVYRYMSTINYGYIVTSEGIRVGVCGEGMYEGRKINSVSNFSSVNIRIPHDFDDAGDSISKYVSSDKGKSILIFSPPGYGKTTVIRSVAKALGNGKFMSPVRVSVIDERGEILPKECAGLIDRFVGYSKPDGIEIAVRLFSPEYVICDEIGLFDDTRAILSVQNSGVPFIATTHAISLSDALERPNIKELIEHRVFDSFVSLQKVDGRVKCSFEEMEL